MSEATTLTFMDGNAFSLIDNHISEILKSYRLSINATSQKSGNFRDGSQNRLGDC
ncbi:MAG TPA: hypothetical protein VH796_07970 [Nitrososphaeraceae archaeon]